MLLTRSRSPPRSSRVERERERERERARAEEPEPDLELINRCRVPRDYLERWANEPYFEKAIKGCFIRVGRGVGNHGQRVYAMAEIINVVPYKRRYRIVSLQGGKGQREGGHRRRSPEGIRSSPKICNRRFV